LNRSLIHIKHLSEPLANDMLFCLESWSVSQFIQNHASLN